MASEAKTTPPHEFANIFALHEGPQIWDLGKRIGQNGQREPCVLLDGKMLDGRRRELACIHEGIKPKYREFGSRSTDGKDPLEFVIDLNLHRRHLGEGERALAAARYATAKAGGDRQSKASSHFATMVATNAEAAERFDTTESKVDRAKKVVANGTPELESAVADDTITVSDAASVADLPDKKQNKAVKEVRSGKAKTVRAAAKPKTGKPLYDDRKIHKILGTLAREFNTRSKVHGGETKEYKDVRQQWENLNAAWKRWQIKKEKN
jgi:hypothetical protein